MVKQHYTILELDALKKGQASQVSPADEFYVAPAPMPAPAPALAPAPTPTPTPTPTQVAAVEPQAEPQATGWLASLAHSTKAAFLSVLIFTVGFFALNATAYSEIIQTSLLEWRGIEIENPIAEKYNAPEEEPEQKLLTVERQPETQKQQIPALNLEVTPPDYRLIIPKINKNIPVIATNPEKLIGADWQSLEKTFQDDLKNGVVHYPGTAKPGNEGNVFITGHSSYYPWDDGRYKTVFARLSSVEVGDEILIFHGQKEYRYVVREKKEVKNSDVSVLSQDTEKKLLTLMTCSPVGTQFKRLVVIAEQVN